MASKRKRETDNLVPDCMSKASDSTYQNFESTVTQIKAKKSKIGDQIDSAFLRNFFDRFFKIKPS